MGSVLNDHFWQSILSASLVALLYSGSCSKSVSKILMVRSYHSYGQAVKNRRDKLGVYVRQTAHSINTKVARSSLKFIEVLPLIFD